MKKLFFAALAAATMLSACSKQDGNNEGGGNSNLKSLEFALGVTSPKTRMSDQTVEIPAAVLAAVRSNIASITIEYFNAAGGTLGTYDFKQAEIDLVKADNQAETDFSKRKAVRIENIPAATDKVNVYMNVKTDTNINMLQTEYKVMEYRGTDAVAIVLQTPASDRTDGSNNDLYKVEVPIQPVLARFEFKGDASTIGINKDGHNNLPTGIIDETVDKAQEHVSAATIASAEAAAKAAWREQNPSVADPTWALTYTVTYTYNEAYTIDAITGYYMNNIPNTKNGSLILNANNANGDWNTDAAASYDTNGSLENMDDLAAPGTGKIVAYNLFPQTFTPAVAGAPTVGEIKAKMPHFILKLKTNTGGVEGTRWITVRAFRSTASGSPLITSFDASKVYILDASEINVNQYSANLKVTANTVAGPEIPEDKDPTDPNPEPQAKDLDLVVKIAEWTVVHVKPEM